MRCCCQKKNAQRRTKVVRMTFKRANLLYDIKNYAYVEGDVMKVDDPHERHQVQDICEDGNIDRVIRILDLAHAECEEALYPYTKEDVGAFTGMDDDPSQFDDSEEVVCLPYLDDERGAHEYVINLLVPDAYSKTTVRLMVKYIHEFMVCRVLADWFSITKPDAAANWRSKQEEALEGMQEAVNFRTGRVRRTLTPW